MKYIFSIFLSLSVFFCFMVLVVYQNMNSVLFSEENRTKIAVYFRSDMDVEQIETIIQSIVDTTKPLTAEKISQAKQVQDFKTAFSENALSQIDENEIMELLPYSVELKYLSLEDMNSAEKFVRSLAEVESVSKSFIWNEKLKLLAQLFSGTGQGLFLFVFLATALTTVALARLLVQTRQISMNVRAFLGERYIQLFKEPLLEILSLFTVSFIIGLAFAQAFYFFFKVKILQNSEFSFLLDRIHMLSFKYILILAAGLLLSCLLGIIVSAFTMRKSIYEGE